jgi:hypothetical protein
MRKSGSDEQQKKIRIVRGAFENYTHTPGE